jgi:hypothetical protein
MFRPVCLFAILASICLCANSVLAKSDTNIANAAAQPDRSKNKLCRADGAVYKPQGKSGDGDYELVLEDLHPETPGTSYVRLHLNLYEHETHRLLSTAALTESCVATGSCECTVSMHGIKRPIDIVGLNKDFKNEGGDLLKTAPYAILLPHITERFYYSVHVDDRNPDVKYFTEPKAMMALPPQVWMRHACGPDKPSRHFGRIE